MYGVTVSSNLCSYEEKKCDKMDWSVTPYLGRINSISKENRQRAGTHLEVIMRYFTPGTVSLPAFKFLMNSEFSKNWKHDRQTVSNTYSKKSGRFGILVS